MNRPSDIAARFGESLISEGFAGSLAYDKSLAPYTTWGVGGPALIVAEIPSKKDLALFFKLASSCPLPVLIIGAGSNLLVSDDGFDGIVIRLAGEFTEASFDNTAVHAGAAYTITKLVRECCRRGLGGIERLAGIPGTVGGAIFMNAGTFDEYIGEMVRDVEIFSSDLRFETVPKSSCGFGYRNSRFQNSDEIILSCTLIFRRGESGSISEEVERRLERRKRTQPIHLPSCGSVFRNPPDGLKAAQLIEQAGLKGMTRGGAMISDLHANFIVNTGNATARDILSLMALVRHTVKEKTGTALIPEVRTCGFESSLEVMLDEWKD